MNRIRVRLIRKLAERIDGVDLSHREAGQTFEVSTSDARLLIAEGWAVPAESSRFGGKEPLVVERRRFSRESRLFAEAADRRRFRRRDK
jgi:hypothetical protein